MSSEANEEYDISARGYLARAKKCLSQSDPSSLFYAAFELRCCIEARQDSYVQAQEKYIKSLPRAYKIGHQAKALRKVFKDDTIAEMTFQFGDIADIILYYTPVPSDLHNAAEKLGDLLHVLQDRHLPDDPWWDATKQRLIELYRGAWAACQGELVCPPLLDRKGNAIGAIEFTGKKNVALVQKMHDKGRQFILRMNYLTSLPPDWIPDL
jgi:hypothetical protein